MTTRRKVLDEFEQRLAPGLVAVAGSLIQSARHRSSCRIRRENGFWLHGYRDGTVVRSRIGGPSPVTRDRYARDVFLFDHQPRPGDTIVDLGAGLGDELCLFSRLVGARGRVVAVEPHPRTFAGLERTIALNGLTNVVPLQCAVVDEPGPVLLTDDLVNHIRNATAGSASDAVRVPGRRLDEMVRSLGIDRVHLLKVNVEGAELAVLESARGILGVVDHLAVSCHDFLVDGRGPDSRRTFDDVKHLLASERYTVRTRPTDHRPWIRYYVYASRRGSGDGR